MNLIELLDELEAAIPDIRDQLEGAEGEDAEMPMEEDEMPFPPEEEEAPVEEGEDDMEMPPLPKKKKMGNPFA